MVLRFKVQGSDPVSLSCASSRYRRSRFLIGAIATFSAATFLTSLVAGTAAAGSSGLKGKLVVLLVDRVGVQDFPSEETPFCARLAREWSAGMMVTRTAEPAAVPTRSWSSYGVGENGADYVTLGEGIRAKGASVAGLSFNSSEQLNGFGGRTAGVLYSSYTGFSAPEAGVVCLGYPQVWRNNEAVGNEDNAGLLGRLLRESKRYPAVVGNSDTMRRPARFAPLVCCDERGAAPYGYVGDGTSVPSPRSPGGYSTSAAGLVAESERLLGTADMLVVDTGDTGRIDRESGKLDPDIQERELLTALKKVDLIARELTSLLDLKESLLLVVSPGAPLEARREGDYLTPFIAAGKGFDRGMLTSSSTRRYGLINNIDFLPTALRFFDLEQPSQVVGAPLSTVRVAGDTVQHLQEMNSQFAVTRKARWPVVMTYGVLAVLFTCAAALCLPWIDSRVRLPFDPVQLRGFIRPASLIMLSAPLSFIIVSAFHFSGALFPALFCAGFSILLGGGAWLLQRGRRIPDPFAAVCLLTSLVMLVDLFFAGRLIMIPLLGVSALEGLRMYGLTNILASLLIATFVWGVSGLAGHAVMRRGIIRWSVFAALLALSFVVGFGSLGANAGAFITALAVALTFFTATSRKGFTTWRAVGVAAATVAGTVFMVLLDSAFVHTHTGKVVSSPAGRIVPLIGRKLLILYGQVSFYLFPAMVLIGAMVALVIWLRRPGSFWDGRWEVERLQTATLYSLVVGSLVALAFNDTGISMLAVMTLVSVLAAAFYVIPDLPTGGGARTSPG